MLRNCYQNTYWYPMRYLSNTTYSLVTILFLPFISEAATQNYRLILTENPTTSALIGWELIGGCPDLQRIYYDTVDHQLDTAAYAFRSEITASIFHQGMENYFCRLKNLLPGTKYYLVIGEDEGLSPRLIFETFSADKKNWRSYWCTSEFIQHPNQWQNFAQQIDDYLPDFLLVDGLDNIASESMWRKWFALWQPRSTEQLMVPMAVAGTISADIQYLYNLPNRKFHPYTIAEQTVLLISEKGAKINKRFWRSLADSTQVFWYDPASLRKLPDQVYLAVTSSPHHKEQLPNVFNLPKKQPVVFVSQQQEKLKIQLPDETVLLEMY